MAEIRDFRIVRHLRGSPAAQIFKYRRGKLHQSGPGLTFWFLPLSASVAEVPLDDRELPFVFHGRSSDFQDVTTQGVVTFRVVEPLELSRRVDFTLDLETGAYEAQPLEKLSGLLTQLAQQHALAYLTETPIRTILKEGHARVRAAIEGGLNGDDGVRAMGIEIATVRVAAVSPTSELERALELPTREKIQQAADEATFERRALAVEKERAIAENELKNRIELSRREEDLIKQTGQNERRRAEETAAAKGLETAAAADRKKLMAAAEADSLTLLENARVAGERERMEIYRGLPTSVMMGLAARELAGKLETIEHLNLTPELLGPLLTDLVRAGTRRLEE